MMDQQLSGRQKRYPGPHPFAYDDRELFFGRDQEIEYLTTVIANNKSTILHGKSGYGKSSLINAGIIPNLLEKFSCEIIRIRFYNCDKNNTLKPRDILINAIKQHSCGTVYLENVITGSHQSAWRYFKKLHLDLLKRPARFDVPELGYILIFDQFEELFTYKKDDVREFAKELQELILHRIPEEYQESLKEAFGDKQQLELYRDELSILDKDIPLKILFSIRADRFNYLTYLVNYIPNLLSNTIKILRLSSDQVRMAILKPALAEGNFYSPNFNYEPVVVERILKFLKTNAEGEEVEKIEGFEMQIICQKLENIVTDYVSNKNNLNSENPVLLSWDMIIESSYIRDKENPFKEIIKNYYIETIQSIEPQIEQLSARYLIEVKLIDQPSGNRISLDVALVNQVGTSANTQEKLIDNRIIRKEVNSVSGISLELSHDSLISPIILAAAELGNLNEKLMHFYNEALTFDDKTFEKKVRDIFYDKLLDHKPLGVAETRIIKSIESPLIRESKPLEGDQGNNQYSLIESFKQTVQQSKNSSQNFKLISQQRHTKDWVKKFILASVLFLVIISFLFYTISENRKTSNKLRALFFLGKIDIIADTVKNKEAIIRLIKIINDKKYIQDGDTSLIRDKFSDLVQSQDIQAKESRLSYTIESSNLQQTEIDFSANGDFIVISGNPENEKEKGNYEIINLQGDTLKSFANIKYAYFTNKDDVVLLAVSDSNGAETAYSRFNKDPSKLVLYNCKSGEQNTISMGAGQYLHPLDVGFDNNFNKQFSSNKVRFSANGNLIVPYYRLSANNGHLQEVKVIMLNKTIRSFPSKKSVVSSRDGRKFMTFEDKFLRLYQEDGKLLQSIAYIYDADFTQNGSLLFIKGSQISLRDSSGKTRQYDLKGFPNFAYTDKYSKFIVADMNDSECAIINTENNSVKYFKEKLVDVNFEKNVLITIAFLEDDNIPDTIKRRTVFGSNTSVLPFPAMIQTLKYNAATDEILLFDKDYKLYLLTNQFKVKAGFQLTTNDLFGFTDDGKRIYYVRNKDVSVFDNSNKLINFFDFRASWNWANNPDHYQKAQNKKEIDLEFLKLKKSLNKYFNHNFF